jgi:uncharacterized protein YndB with AHSA1/START domain/predicted Ser/Thr protein kinase
MTDSDANPTITSVEATSPLHRGGFIPPSPEELNARIPNLEVTELLGHGGMGVVYKGHHPLLDRPVAIKVLRPDFQTDDDFQSRFLREARTLAKLRHPYIVTVYDLGRLDDLYYLVMEFVEGASLRERLVARSISERDALDFVPQIAEALQHSHETGVVHRDIKPENVLIDPRGRVRLVDFGLATLFGPQGSRNPDDNRVAGTLGYMAPEQITMPEAVDHRADIYSTGVVFYEMLAGCLPKADRVPPSRKAASDPRLDPIVLRALERERELRYQEARLLHSEITALARTPATTIRLEQHILAPVEQVFDAWTDPRGMATWYAPSDDFGPTDVEVDVQVGGAYRVQMHPPVEDQPFVVSGHYCIVDRPRRLSFTWAWTTPYVDTQETQITLDFHARGETTDLVLTHERFRDEGRRDGHNSGWQGCLVRLARKFGS